MDGAFRFDFAGQSPSPSLSDEDDPRPSAGDKATCPTAATVLPAERVEVRAADVLATVRDVTSQARATSVKWASHLIKVTPPATDTLFAVGGNSDLVPDVYEGGLKVWEAAQDMVEYLITEAVDVRGKRVLELGCGAGLPGIECLRAGAAAVAFCDYNREVLDHVTVPNVYLNATVTTGTDTGTAENGNGGGASARGRGDEWLRRSAFYSGDWGSLADLLLTTSPGGYDLVVTTETIYNAEHYEKLLDVLTRCLAPTGQVLLGAKSYYFGVGGGIVGFRAAVEARGALVCRKAWALDDGLSREILILTHKSPLR